MILVCITISYKLNCKNAFTGAVSRKRRYIWVTKIVKIKHYNNNCLQQ